ncbi:hypothetical protein [Brevundimonas sp.]|uniref:hypothetical protein n=1 Tax=Brevundimonas sp. TaxID=1871086 RepID=UPI003B007296
MKKSATSRDTGAASRADTLTLRPSGAETPRRRRVLQIDYSADDLPGGLQWLGV